MGAPLTERGFLAMVAVGIAAGLMAGLFGIGGGVVMIPPLVAWLGLTQHEAHATSLAAIIPIAAAGAVTFGLDGGGGCGRGRAIRDRIHRRSPARRWAHVYLERGSPESSFRLTGRDGGELARMDLSVGLVALTAVYSLVAGAVSGLLGIGGGILIVPFLVLALGETQHLAEGTSLLVIVPTAMMGVWSHHRKGYVRFGAALKLGVGGVVGSIAGASLALAFSAEALSKLFGAFTVFMGIHFVRSGLRSVRSSSRRGDHPPARRGGRGS